jgi:hypothetical protein
VSGPVYLCLGYCWSTCTKSGECVVLYICVWGIVEVPVLSQESDHSLSWLSTGTSTIPQTQIYRTTHSPDLVQALQQYLKHRYTGSDPVYLCLGYCWSACTKSGEWVILYICVWGIVENRLTHQCIFIYLNKMCSIFIFIFKSEIHATSDKVFVYSQDFSAIFISQEIFLHALQGFKSKKLGQKCWN